MNNQIKAALITLLIFGTLSTSFFLLYGNRKSTIKSDKPIVLTEKNSPKTYMEYIEEGYGMEEAFLLAIKTDPDFNGENPVIIDGRRGIKVSLGGAVGLGHIMGIPVGGRKGYDISSGWIGKDKIIVILPDGTKKEIVTKEDAIYCEKICDRL